MQFTPEQLEAARRNAAYIRKIETSDETRRILADVQDRIAAQMPLSIARYGENSREVEALQREAAHVARLLERAVR